MFQRIFSKSNQLVSRLGVLLLIFCSGLVIGEVFRPVNSIVTIVSPVQYEYKVPNRTYNLRNHAKYDTLPQVVLEDRPDEGTSLHRDTENSQSPV